jgi:hypothetical protein
MSSGYPDLDQAAIRVAEASTYAAASENGQTRRGLPHVQGEVHDQALNMTKPAFLGAGFVDLC